MKLIIKNDYEAMCAWAAEHIADAIRRAKGLKDFHNPSSRIFKLLDILEGKA